jgi:hypothetical protein
MEDKGILRRWGYQILMTIGSQMAVRLSALSTGQPPFTLREVSGTQFYYSLNWLQGHDTARRIKSIDRNLDLPACSFVPQPTTLSRYSNGLLAGERRSIPWVQDFSLLHRVQIGIVECFQRGNATEVCGWPSSRMAHLHAVMLNCDRGVRMTEFKNGTSSCRDA